VNPRARLGMWMRDTGRTATSLASEIGCSRPMLSLVLSGARTPGLGIAIAIEDLSASWAKGSIRAREWLSVASAKPAAKQEATS